MNTRGIRTLSTRHEACVVSRPARRPASTTAKGRCHSYMVQRGDHPSTSEGDDGAMVHSLVGCYSSLRRICIAGPGRATLVRVSTPPARPLTTERRLPLVRAVALRRGRSPRAAACSRRTHSPQPRPSSSSAHVHPGAAAARRLPPSSPAERWVWTPGCRPAAPHRRYPPLLVAFQQPPSPHTEESACIAGSY